MKKIFLGLAVLGLISLKATAQTKPCSVYDQNFKVHQTKYGYTTGAQLEPSCNQPADMGTQKAVNYARTASYTTRTGSRTISTGKGKSRYDINYAVCANKTGYKLCSQQELQQQMSEAPINDQSTSQTPVCNVDHNGIIVSYYDRESCLAAQAECNK